MTGEDKRAKDFQDVPEGSVTPEIMQGELEKIGHIVTSLDAVGSLTLPMTAVATMFKVGLPDNDEAPTIFKMWFPLGCTIEAHTHACDYAEIIMEGSQKVGPQCLHKGDIRVGLANRGYGPLVAGPVGVSILVIFSTGAWPGIALGNNLGSTLGTSEITNKYDQT